MSRRPEQTILPPPHCRQHWPRPRTVQAGPDPRTDEQLAAIHTHSWPKSGNLKEAELFPDNGGGWEGGEAGGREGHCDDMGDLILQESDKCCYWGVTKFPMGPLHQHHLGR